MKGSVVSLCIPVVADAVAVVHQMGHEQRVKVQMFDFQAVCSHAFVSCSLLPSILSYHSGGFLFSSLTHLSVKNL